MIHAKAVYEQVQGEQCDCGKYRSREYILRRMRERPRAVTQNGIRLLRTDCTCGCMLNVRKLN